MSPRDQTVIVFVIVIGALLLASVVGMALKRLAAGGADNAAIDNLNARIRAWWVMITALAVAFALGRSGVIVLFAFASFAALREFITLTYTRRADHTALALCFFVILPAQYWLVYIGWYGLYSIFIPIYAFLILPITSALAQDSTRFLERTAKVQWGLMICVFCISHVPALLTLDIPGFEGRLPLLIVFLAVIAEGSDVLQYVWGKLFGKHQVAPRLSPSKTLEGLVGGVASATLVGALLYRITPFNPWQAALMSLLICLMGFLGGLVMSAIKRDRGVKDWGRMIEGHGGMLDRLDSLCFAAPIFFHLTRYFWTK
jgi:phosphatidate cytidylyltransferase